MLVCELLSASPHHTVTTTIMEESLRRARVHRDSETSEVKAELSIERNLGLALSSSQGTTAAPTTPHDAAALVTPTMDMTSDEPSYSDQHGNQVLDTRSRRAPSKFASPDANTLCSMCPATGRTACNECQSVTYCTPLCRDADLKSHQILCSTRAEYEHRPGEAMRRAIYFPDTPGEPLRFTWVKFQEAWTEDNERFQTALVGSYFNVPQDRRSSYYLTENHVLCRPLTRTIRIIAANDNSAFAQTNPSIVDQIDQRHAYPWKGPLLAIALQGTATNPSLPLGDDLAVEDLRHVLDFLNTFQSTAISADFDRYFGRTVRGVRINSSGDQKSVELPDEFEPVRVPTTHAVFHQKTPATLPIPHLLELPITYSKCPRRPDLEAACEIEKWGVRKSDWNSPFRDLQQSWLLAGQQDFATTAFAMVHTNDTVAEYYCGSAILVRQDEKPLLVPQLEALWRYNKFLLEPRMTQASQTVASSSSSDQSKEERATVDAYLRKARFAQFYSDGRCYQKSAAERAFPSPYEMKKRSGQLKRKSSKNFFDRVAKKYKWEWISDCDESGTEKDAGEAEEQK
ncbi:hypothetical protein NX059_011672 [Plenodomus lindquistii]|nr:hypothetical protein NX059_011672 [Plenodomus lindquistii]